jgi:hypothetical protein
MKKVPKIQVDFNSFDGESVALYKRITIKDLMNLKIDLEEGMELELYELDPVDDNENNQLTARGIAHYDTTISKWVAKLVTKVSNSSEPI